MEMNSQPKVSILVPLYNKERYFKAFIQSITNQTYSNFEVILVNDGSTDKSPSMAREWSCRDNRISVIDKPNEGPALARRDGLKKAQGEYIMFADSDDLLPPRAIEILVTKIVELDADLVIGSSDKKLGFITRHHLDSIYSFPTNVLIKQPELFEKYYLGFFSNTILPVSMWGRIYRKSVIDTALKENTMFSEDINYMGEDQYFNLLLFPYLHSMYRTNDTVYIYRYGGYTLHFNRHFTQLLDLSSIRHQLLDKYKYTSGYGPLYDEYIECLYYHASELIHYKQTDREGVINFFEHELDTRDFIPRLKDYYKNEVPSNPGALLLIEQNYDGMYRHASRIAYQNHKNIKNIIKRSILAVIERF